MKFGGYACLFLRADLSGDVIVKGAFDKCLGQSRPAQIKMLYQHDAMRPIGVWQKIKPTAQGLWVEGEITTKARLGQDVAALIRSGALDGPSIGFRARRADKSRRGQRHLKEIELVEVSLVTFPMQPKARVVKIHAGSQNLAPALRQAVAKVAVA